MMCFEKRVPLHIRERSEPTDLRRAPSSLTSTKKFAFWAWVPHSVTGTFSQTGRRQFGLAVCSASSCSPCTLLNLTTNMERTVVGLFGKYFGLIVVSKQIYRAWSNSFETSRKIPCLVVCPAVWGYPAQKCWMELQTAWKTHWPTLPTRCSTAAISDKMANPEKVNGTKDIEMTTTELR